MTNPFVAEIRIFPFNFAPTQWAFCSGQLLPISQNTALFSLLGTTYGGDGKSNFALPNMQGNVAIHPGQGPGLPLYDLGETGGSATVTLLESEIPSHPHALKAVPIAGNVNTPGPQAALARSDNATAYQTNTSQNLVQMSGSTIAPSGSSQPHNNLMPYLVLNYCIALQGIYPPRT
jgi:microcystin-dependent protein